MTTDQANQLKFIYDNLNTTLQEINVIEPKEMYFCHYDAAGKINGLYYNGSVTKQLSTATSNTGKYLSMARSTRTNTFTALQNCQILFYNSTNDPFASGVYKSVTKNETFTVYDSGNDWCFAILIK